jgi:hypothetical protein
MTRYEDILDRNPGLALREGGAHFDGESAVHQALRRVASRLEQLGVAYALVGGMALFLHGYRRFTEDVDILVTAPGLDRIHQALGGHGYRPLLEGSRGLREAETGVRIDFVVAGEFPGDGKPKPVAFPEPGAASEVVEGIHCLRLAPLIEIKLAAGACPARLRDQADVQELIRRLRLPADYSECLDPSVRERYRDLWQGLQELPPER